MTSWFVRTWTLTVAAAALLLSGCSAVQDIRVEETGAGEADVRIDLSEPFVSYLVDLMGTIEGHAEGDPNSVFDVEAIRNTFDQQSNLHLESIDRIDDKTLELTVAFSSITALMAEQGTHLSRLLRFEKAGTFFRIAADLDRRSVERALELAAIDQELAEFVLPPEGAMSADEYAEYLHWALEEYTDDENYLQTIKDSAIVTNIRAEGPIIQQSGGYYLGDRVRFSTSVMQLLTASEPLQYSLVFTADQE